MILLRGVLSLLVLFLANPSYGEDAGSAALAALKNKFPKMTVDRISTSPIKGIFEVVSGANIFYFDPAGGHLLFGEIWTETGKNITAEARAGIRSVRNYSLEKE